MQAYRHLLSPPAFLPHAAALVVIAGPETCTR